MNNINYIPFVCKPPVSFIKSTLATQLSKKPTLHAVSKPDLSVTLEPPEKTLYQNHTYTFRGTVNNVGSVFSPPSKVSLSLCNIGASCIPISDEQDIAGLPPGWGNTVVFQGRFDSTFKGKKKVSLMVDPSYLIDETNEGNNISRHVVTCVEPDHLSDPGIAVIVAPNAQGLSTHEGYANDPVSIYINVENYLAGSSTPPITVTISCDEQTDQIAPFESIPPKRQYKYTRIWSTTGIKHCQARLSEGPPGYADSNESNNLVNFQVQISAP